jgi:hypothetical protein
MVRWYWIKIGEVKLSRIKMGPEFVCFWHDDQSVRNKPVLYLHYQDRLPVLDQF